MTVYCQVEANQKNNTTTTTWRGIELVHVPVAGNGALSTIVFDFKSIRHSLRSEGIILTLGYNTAIFNIMHRLKKRINIINMDGIEWRREKWSRIAKMWFWFNERLACWIANHLIADHPAIKEHLATRIARKKISMIPYGAPEVTTADESCLDQLGLVPGGFSILIARPEPENSILEIVRAFSVKSRNHLLVVLGNYDPERNNYHYKVKSAASDEVIFLGAIYEKRILDSLRFYCRLYIHGHKVGGTNPSLVEALGANCSILAHNNQFNRWVAGEAAHYFDDEEDCSRKLESLLHYKKSAEESRSYQTRFRKFFAWNKVLSQYDELLRTWHGRSV